MVAVNEGNSECLRCEHFDLGLGCALIAVKNKLPPCGRNVVLTQEEYRSLLLKNVKIAELVDLCINGKISCENLLKSRDISRDKRRKSMTIREFVEFIDEDKNIRIYDGENKILQINTRYIRNIKNEILDRKIKKAGIHIMNNYVINIHLEEEGE